MSGGWKALRGRPAVAAIMFLLGAMALLAGVYGRFKGIGTWPLGADEFYISRSIDNVLRSGLPAFPCGGYYTRGLAYQYVVAGLRLGGMSPEFAGRFVAGLCSLALLPAAFLLGKRLQGPLAGYLLVIVLCLSVWEIEMARFARMYAPFQTLFAWYLVAYLRFTIDKRAAGLAWMAILSVFGVLIWEGGVLLGVANLFAIVAANNAEKLKLKDWRRLGLLCVLLALLYLATRDLRGFAEPPAAGGPGDEPTSPLREFFQWFAPLIQHPALSVGLLLPLSCAVPVARWLAGFQRRGLLFWGLCSVLIAAAVHSFLIVAGLVLLMLLMRLLEPQELSWRRARYFWLMLAAWLLLWGVLAASSLGFTGHAVPGVTPQAGDFEAIWFLWGYPNVLDHVVRPWLRTAPFLSLGIVAAIVYLCRRAIAGDRGGSDPVAVLLSLTVVLVLVVGASPTDRIETRYTFFLYPLLALFAICAILPAMQERERMRRLPILFPLAVPLLCFALSEDFQPRHILEVDSARTNFRVGMPRHRAEHYYPRNDVRGAAEWLDAHVQPGDAVITGIPSLDQYYAHIDYSFLDVGDARYETYVCSDGKTERWTNRPVIYTLAALVPVVAAKHRVFATVFAVAEQSIMGYAATAGWSVTRVWTADSGTADVLLITAASGP